MRTKTRMEGSLLSFIAVFGLFVFVTRAAELPLLEIAIISADAGATITLHHGNPNDTFHIEHASSPSSSTWIALGQVTLNSSGAATYVDSQTAGVSIRYYRARRFTQQVWSQNIVGFVKLHLQPGWSMMANPFVRADQTVPDVLGGLPDGVTVLTWNPVLHQFVDNSLFGDWAHPGKELLPYGGFFFHNPFATNLSVVVSGEAVFGFISQGSDLWNPPAGTRPPAGYSIISLPNGGDRLWFPEADGDQILFWWGSAFAVRNFDGEGWLPEFNSAIGESFFYYNPGGGRMATVTGELSSAEISPLTEPGYLNLFTFNADPAFGRVFEADGITGVSRHFTAQFYGGTTAEESSLLPIAEPLSFLSGAGAGYLRGGVTVLPQLQSATVHLQLRVWDSSAGQSYESALMNGGRTAKSALFSAALTSNIHPPPFANGFPSFRVPGIYFAPAEDGLSLNNGVFRATVRRFAHNGSVIIESSADLVNWTEIASSNEEVIEVIHAASPGTVALFYRARTE
jgi:hypothetical protein